jgi:phosphoribosylformylglycinamidine synthase subunit PurL
VVAMQDLGAAGLTSSAVELASRGGAGVRLDVAHVPRREAGMTPYEVMLSESQERMLVVAEPGRVAEIEDVCARWELTATPIGRVTDDGLFRVRHHGLVVAAIPGQRLVEDCPIYHPEAREGEDAVVRRAARPPAEPPIDLEAALPTLLDSPNIASKRWVYEQYDSTVQASTVLGPGGDAGVFRVPGTGFGVAVSVDCNNRLVSLDPREGGKAAVAEAARNVACTGARPLGITDCLNFGNPEKPEVFFQFREACRGIAEACEAFGTPVTGGNVSFYNESPTGAVDPTPTVGMIGLLERVDRRVPSHFSAEGDVVLMLGDSRGELGGSAYWAELRGFIGGPVPPVDLEAERQLQRVLVEGASGGLLRSAHDCAEGGLLVALAEAAIGGPYATAGVGATLSLDGYADGVPLDGLLYGEDMGRVVVSCTPGELNQLIALCRRHGVPAFEAGRIGRAGGALELRAGGRLFSWSIGSLRQTYFEAIPRRMRQPDADRAAGA